MEIQEKKIYRPLTNIPIMLKERCKENYTSVPFPENVTYNDYTYNSDGSIKSVHVSYSWKDDQSDLDYSYTIE